MFASLRSFLYRHRRKFFVSGLLIGGGILLTRYVQRALRGLSEQEVKLYLERSRKQQHYESNERTCNKTALTLLPPLKEAIIKLINTEEMIAELKNGATNKVALWETLKIMAFSKVVLLIYVSSIVMVTLRLQLNLISGYLFRDESKEKISSELQEKYLKISQNLLGEGTTKLCDIINEKVKLVVSKRPLNEKLTIKDVEQILWAIHSSVSADPKNPCQQLATYVIIDDSVDGLAPQQAEIYQTIISETRDLFESEEVMSICSSCVTRGLTYVLDSIAEYFVSCPSNETVPAEKPHPPSTPDSFFAANMTGDCQLPDVGKVTIPMAKIIPIVNGLVSNRKSSTDLPSMWMQQLILMDDLKVMGANVYETFSVK